MHVADSKTLQVLSLTSGIGWLDEGVRAGCEHLGFNYCVQGYCEWEAYATTVLLARMEDESLEPAPVFCGDLAGLDAVSMRGHVDLIVAGFPCQPWSAAGQQQGTADARWLWPDIARIIRHAEPALVFLENVPGLVSGGGLHHVLDDLAEMRFDAEWCHLSAADVGASHKRERVFILAYASGQGQQERRCERYDDEPQQPSIERDVREMGNAEHSATRDRRTNGEARTESQKRRGLHGPVEPSRVLGDTERNGRRIDKPGRRQDQREALVGAGEWTHGDLAYKEVYGDFKFDGTDEIKEEFIDGVGPIDESWRAGQSGGKAPSQRKRNKRAEPRRPPFFDGEIFAPGPSDSQWRQVLSDYAHFAPAIEPGFRVRIDGELLVVDQSRADQLRCAGNGVVALQAAVAFVELMRRISAGAIPDRGGE